MASRLTLARAADLFAAHRTATLSALGIAIVLPLAVNDYRIYLSYGPGGLPYNIAGWLIANTLHLFGREQLSTRVYADKTLPFADQPGLLPAGFPPQRRSSRPKLSRHPVPQRQLDQLPDEAMREKLMARFAQLGQQAQALGLVEVRQSVLERQHPALFVSKARTWHSVARQTGGEIAHVHAGLDGTMHVSLHPADCKRVMDAGWGQRHGLDGVALLQKAIGVSLPVNYLLIYAPRDQAETEVAIAIVEASIGFMTGTRDALE
ncbi:hypothetical protein K505DRAFT_380718 [Melanomma pulvis-pyrius CBS 109.77]|uniref:Luciferase domain-containing protein n=1 Tax=Melanomma pulvis-pyrius CBS 109.77 TaxID=1314802 RepID=A0A6A6WNQ7_9PLEO|nr:hypothetical protein K505DRAFT_380718 [Melanomma pulvis-pyrius CBS 109.77]